MPQKRWAQSGWRRLAPGIRQLALTTGGGAKARLLKLKPGTVLPEHGHRGTELTILLAGSYTDALGQFRRGDMRSTMTRWCTGRSSTTDRNASPSSSPKRRSSSAAGSHGWRSR